MAFKDFREYISTLMERGEVQVIQKEVSPILEVGAVIRRSYDLRAPAPFFHRLAGFPEGFRIFGAPVGLSRKPGRTFIRLSTTLGLAPETSYTEIMDALISRLRARRTQPISPVVIPRQEAPCKENIMLGEETDIELFPAPLIHGGDGGRYIGTWHTIITKDPDTGWVNWGMYRLMVVDRNRLTGLLHTYPHIGRHYFGKYEPRRQPMPFAIAFGTEPVTALVSGTRLAKEGEDEADLVCALRGEPLELVPCETVDLLVPATSEIVFEGEVMPGEREMEGPFGEYPGYRVAESAPRPVFRVKAITYRRHPILPVTCVGVPIDDDAAFKPLFKAALTQLFLQDMGFPIKRVYCPPEGVGYLMVISTQIPYVGYPRDLANLVIGAPFVPPTFYLIIVNEDVEVTNLEQIVWSLVTRCHPARGIFIYENTRGSPLLPFASREERRQGRAAQVWFDATWPLEWSAEEVPVKASFDVMWPQEVQEKVLTNWKDYGYT